MIDAVPADGAVGRDAGPAILFNAILLIQSIIPPQTTSHTFNCGSLSETSCMDFRFYCMVLIPIFKKGFCTNTTPAFPDGAN